MASQYCTQTDLNNRFGAMNITKWSNMDGSSNNADTNRICVAINYAGDYIDNRLRRSKYVLPLASNTGQALCQLVDWAVIIASWWLYTSRGLRDNAADPSQAKLDVLRQGADTDLDKLLNGQIELDAQFSVPIGATGPTCV